MLIEIDARGLACPKPVINTKKELDKLENGIVVVTIDNSIAKENILKLASSLNCETKIVRDQDDLIVMEIKKGENVIIENKKNNELENKCIFISSDKMGKGNEELGDVLIKGFIYTLTEVKPFPKYIVFVNSGVTLTAQNKATIEHLKILEESGVEVLSCGTCLDYYGLKETLQVGCITNMYNIVDIMKSASQTISI